MVESIFLTGLSSTGGLLIGSWFGGKFNKVGVFTVLGATLGFSCAIVNSYKLIKYRS